MSYTFQDQTLLVDVDKSIYSLDVIYKCIYWYTGKYSVEVHDSSEKYTTIGLKLLDGKLDLSVATHLKEKILNDLIDFKLRDIVTKETSTIRELIVAKAFSNYEVGSENEFHLSDPVGFNPQQL